MMISIVTSLYRSEKYVVEFYERVINSAEKITTEVELIFVNDNSPDSSCEAVKNIISKDKRVKLIDLSRNFGHARAMLAGLENAKGDYIFALDCDLEESPEWLTSFYEEMLNQKADCVIGNINKRTGISRSVSGYLFFKVFKYLTGVALNENQTWARLMNKRFLAGLMRYPEFHLFLNGIFNDVGFKQVYFPVDKPFKGTSSYTFQKRVSVALDAITSFGIKPMVSLFIFGISSALFFAVLGLLVLIRAIYLDDFASGWPSLIISIWFIGSLLLMFIATVGIYIAKTFEETKRRPRYIVKEIYE